MDIMDKLVMEIDDYKSINKAKIEINKINVVGGVNGSGKSTVSKILYSFLFANSQKRKDVLFLRLVEELNKLLEELEHKLDKKIFSNKFSVDDNYEDVINKYNQLLKYSKQHINTLYEIIVDEFNNIKPILIEEGMSKEDLKNSESEDFLKNIIQIDEVFSKHTNKKLDDIKKLVFEYDYFNPDDNIYFNLPNLIDKLIKLLADDGIKVSFEVMNEILSMELNSISRFNFYITNENNSNIINPFIYYFKNGFIDNVFYVDNVSILDLKYSDSKIFHMDELFNILSSSETEIIKNNNSKIILRKIDELIKGSYGKSDYSNFFTTNKADFSDMFLLSEFNDLFERNRIETSHHNTPSGIKQIGIIQLLLINNQLKKDDYLIIDEPEVNLHPEWQFKFAEILVLLAKDLNITIYLNSHSPMFIESINAFSEYYDMQDDVNYYLTEESDVYGKYDFTKVPPNKLYKIYNNLGNVYDLIDKLRLEKHLGE